jgi:hypothetical protein
VVALFLSAACSSRTKISYTDEYSIQRWATNVVNAWSDRHRPNSPLGSYDMCLTLENELNAYLKANPHVSGVLKERVRGIGNDHSYDLQNACAIVMYGAEY